jgi:hypothetical protein
MNDEPSAAAPMKMRNAIRRAVTITTTALTSFLLASAADGPNAADVSPGPTQSAVSFESIAGSKVKRIILTEKAAQRLGLETGQVGEDRVVRKQVVGGVFVAPSALPGTAPVTLVGAFTVQGGVSASQSAVVSRSAPTPPLAPGEGVVRVMFSQQEWDRVAKDQPARVRKLIPRSELQDGAMAKSLDTPPIEDFKRSMLTQYYVVIGQNHGLVLNERVRVELQLADSEGLRKVVPYGAVYYDARGDAWVYLNSKPLVYERHPIKVEQVIGEVAVLSEGPSAGTSIVTVGAALLYGTEIYGK